MSGLANEVKKAAGAMHQTPGGIVHDPTMRVGRSLSFCVFLLGMSSSATAAKPVDALVKKVQTLYEKTKDFETDFIQIYTRVALGNKTSEQRGKLRFKKPGMVRFDYTKPEEKYFVADGKQLFIYEPEEAEVQIKSGFKASALNSSLLFLFGEGKLSEQFNAKLDDKTSDKGEAVLELTPKKDPTYKKLILHVDAKTGQVKRTVLFETSGNTNEFRFTNPKFNVGLKENVFQFKPPPGVEIIKLP